MSQRSSAAEFVAEMKVQGRWDDVVVVTNSDFGRTLATNGQEANGYGGTEHAWGGNYFMLGGSVRGGQIHGQFPRGLDGQGPRSKQIAHGSRVIPTSPWEALWHGVAQSWAHAS